MINKIKTFDGKVIDYIDKKFNNSIMDSIMKVVTFLGDYAVIWVFIVVYLLHKDRTIEGLSIVCSLASTSLLNEKILKKIFKRTRPAIKKGYKKLVVKIPTSYSFPSGHTATAFAVVPLALKFGTVIGIISVVAATIIGFSRVYLKVHYLSDVLMGAMLGTIISFGTYIFIFM